MFVDPVKGAHADEDVEVHRGADRLRPAAGRSGHRRRRSLPEDGRQPSHPRLRGGRLFFRWKQKYGGLGPSELRRLRQLEEENQKLKRLVADLSLDKAMLQEVLAKKV
jgi:hypothetical protein